MESPVGKDKDDQGSICHTPAENQVHLVYEPSDYDSLSYATYSHITTPYLNINIKKSCYKFFNSASFLHIHHIYIEHRVPTRQHSHSVVFQSNSAQTKACISEKAW